LANYVIEGSLFGDDVYKLTNCQSIYQVVGLCEHKFKVGDTRNIYFRLKYCNNYDKSVTVSRNYCSQYIGNFLWATVYIYRCHRLVIYTRQMALHYVTQVFRALAAAAAAGCWGYTRRSNCRLPMLHTCCWRYFTVSGSCRSFHR